MMGPREWQRVTDNAITEQLVAWRQGDPEAANRVFDLVYGELRVLARRIGGARPGRTLTTTALVHEVYLKFSHQPRIDLEDRRHFLFTAARAMRQIVLDHARRRSALKRGGGARPADVDHEAFAIGVGRRAVDVEALDEALGRLASCDRRLSQLVELRFFGGLSLEEIGGLLGVSERTLKRDWQKARAFLYRELSAYAR
jgi:RNA polymerase sigma factor (TIGR02999 family)